MKDSAQALKERGTAHASAFQRMRVCPTFRAAVGITAHSSVHDILERASCKADITRYYRIRPWTINMR
jgi:hypothetical protein